MDPTTKAPASQLFSCVMEFFSLVLRQETWPLNYIPGSTPKEVDDGVDCDGPLDIYMDSTIPTCGETEYALRSWQMTRFLLNEERERLCLWKFDFTDDDLNRLTAGPANIFGGAVIRSLVSIGQALLKGVGKFHTVRQYLSSDSDSTLEHNINVWLIQTIDNG